MATRVFRRINESFDECIYQCQSFDDRDQMLRVIPNPCPSTHKVVAEWISPMEYRIGPVPVAEPLAPGTPRDELEGMTIPDLQNRAMELGLKFRTNDSKARLVALILEAGAGPNA